RLNGGGGIECLWAKLRKGQVFPLIIRQRAKRAARDALDLVVTIRGRADEDVIADVGDSAGEVGPAQNLRGLGQRIERGVQMEQPVGPEDAADQDSIAKVPGHIESIEGRRG